MLPAARGQPLLEAFREHPGSALAWVEELVEILAVLHAHGLALGAVLPERAVLQASGRVGLSGVEPVHALTEFAEEDWPFGPRPPRCRPRA